MDLPDPPVGNSATYDFMATLDNDDEALKHFKIFPPTRNKKNIYYNIFFH